MHPSIDSIDDGERRAPEFVIEPAGDEPADHGFAMAFALERPGRWRAGCAILCKGLVQPLDDIAAFPKRAQALLPRPRPEPSARGRPAPQALAARASASGRSGSPAADPRGFALRPKIDHPFRPSRFPGQHPIEPCVQRSCRHFRFKTAPDLEL